MPVFALKTLGGYLLGLLSASASTRWPPDASIGRNFRRAARAGCRRDRVGCDLAVEQPHGQVRFDRAILREFSISSVLNCATPTLSGSTPGPSKDNPQDRRVAAVLPMTPTLRPARSAISAIFVAFFFSRPCRLVRKMTTGRRSSCAARRASVRPKACSRSARPAASSGLAVAERGQRFGRASSRYRGQHHWWLFVG